MASKRKVRALRAVNIREAMEQRARALFRRQEQRVVRRARTVKPLPPQPLQTPMQAGFARAALTQRSA